jgi:hypothetical protein
VMETALEVVAVVSLVVFAGVIVAFLFNRE